LGQYIAWYQTLAVHCAEWEVVLDVVAYALAATKHATAVVLHALQSGIQALHGIVTSLLQHEAATENFTDQPVEEARVLAKAEQLRAPATATRLLQLVYELHCHVHDRVSASTTELLAALIEGLLPFTGLAVSPSPEDVTSSVTVSADAMDVVDGVESPPQVGPQSFFNAPTTTPVAQTTAEPQAADPTAPALAACAAKWGPCKQLTKTELGKRAKGYFLVLSLERAQSSSTVPRTEDVSAVAAEAALQDTAQKPELGVSEERCREEVLVVVADLVGHVLLQNLSAYSASSTTPADVDADDDGPAAKAPRFE
jgi:hypothetical protein